MDSGTVDAIRSKVEDTGELLIPKPARKSRWKAFSKAPKDYKEKETDVFKRLKNVCSSIGAAGEEVLLRRPSAYFKSTPENSFESEVTNPTFRSDGCFIIVSLNATSFQQSTDRGGQSRKGARVTGASNPKSTQQSKRRTRSASAKDAQHSPSSSKWKGRPSEGKAKGSDLLRPGEQKQPAGIQECDVVALFSKEKKNNTIENLEDDIRTIIGAASHCLYNDPCRRFRVMFGWTIENTSARLWYFSRSFVVVSEKSDFQKDVDILIHFAASLMFAQDHELGYDPTVERHVDKDGQIRYKYTVEGKCYLTIQILSDYLSTRIVGRSTRVWKVCIWEHKDLDDPPCFALKDYWIDAASPTERDIQNKIFSRINRINPMDGIGNSSQWSQYFMTIIANEIINFGDAGEDRTLSVLSSSHIFNLRTLQSKTVKPGTSTRSVPQGATSHLPSASRRRGRRFFPPKKHCRVIFEEVGECLNLLTDLKSVFTALEHGAQALKLMYTAGYVHRDISAGNILLCGNRGKLSDLEYSRPFETLADEESLDNEFHHLLSYEKTGTPAFMAIEISAGFHYWSYPNPATYRMQNFLSNFAAPSTSLSTNPVIHNYLHDLESLWWIGCYMLLTTTPTNSLDGHPLRLPKQKKHAEDIFPHTMGAVQARYKLFCEETYFAEVCKVLAPDSRPLTMEMVAMNGDLIEQYQEFKRDMETSAPAKVCGRV